MIIEEMHSVDLTGKTNQEINDIITDAGRTAEKQKAASRTLGLKANLKTYDKNYLKLQRIRDKPENFITTERDKNGGFQVERKNFKHHCSDPKCGRDSSNTKGIESSEFEQ
jgi:hypothetical protein